MFYDCAPERTNYRVEERASLLKSLDSPLEQRVSNFVVPHAQSRKNPETFVLEIVTGGRKTFHGVVTGVSAPLQVPGDSASVGKKLKGWRAAAEETEILRPAKQNAGSQDDMGLGSCAQIQSIERVRVGGGAAGEQQVLRLRLAIRFAYRQTALRMTGLGRR